MKTSSAIAWSVLPSTMSRKTSSDLNRKVRLADPAGAVKSDQPDIVTAKHFHQSVSLVVTAHKAGEWAW
jgi:hypothetical protein